MKFSIDNKEIDVIINRKNIKNIYIRVKDNIIIVNANKNASDKYIESLLKKEVNSLKKMLEKNVEKKSDKVYYLGNELKYTYNLIVNVNQFECTGPSIDDVNDYIEKKSLTIFESRLESLKKLFKDLPEFRLRIRKMKTRWGVCNKGSMTVTLNTELIHKDVSLIDYVIIHELCHFKYMNHSKLFWMEVEKYYPYYKEARKMLKE